MFRKLNALALFSVPLLPIIVKKSGVGDQCKLRMSAQLPCGDHGTHAARPPTF